MAYAVDWNNKVVTIPPGDLTLVQPGPPLDVRRLDVDDFRKKIRAIEASEEGIVYDYIVDNTEPTPVDSQTTLARIVRVVNGYTVKFDDASGDYMAQMSGGNTNLADLSVLEPTGVSVLSANSAGLIVTSGGGGSGGDVNVVSVGGTPVFGPDDLKADVSDLAKEATAQSILTISTEERDAMLGRWLRLGTQLILYGPDNTTELARFELYKNGTPVSGPEDIVTERKRL